MHYLYKDSFIEVTEDSLIIANYYFPGVGKEIALEDIVSIKVLVPGMTNGGWRLWGMGLLPIWFAIDWKRPWRDKIFVVSITDASLAAGFTCESSTDVIKVLAERGIALELE